MSPFNPGGRWDFDLFTTEAYDSRGSAAFEIAGEETALTSGISTGGLDKASATTLALPSIYRMSVVNSETTES